jgi:hypothetical protein
LLHSVRRNYSDTKIFYVRHMARRAFFLPSEIRTGR